jgi:hypothetical protein
MRMAIGVALGILSMGLLLGFQPAKPQRPVPAPPQVLVLGVTHLARSGDAVQTEKMDVLGEAAQEQIKALVADLARFRPDKIMVEYPAADQAGLDRLYNDYREGRRATSKNERDQVAFRLAKQLGHTQVYAFDHPSNMNFGSLMECAQETGRQELIENFQKRIGQITTWSNELQAQVTIGEQLSVLNEPRYEEAGHKLYMSLLDFDTADRNPAAKLLTDWYDRNLKMHATMRRLAGPGDRVLVIVGAAHAKHLRDFVRQDPTMRPVDPAAYLPKLPEAHVQSFLEIGG